MNVLDAIKSDHRKVEGLFSEFKQAEEDTKKFIVTKICHELKAHAFAEEQVVYPVVKEVVSAEEEQHAEEEHDGIEEIVLILEQENSDVDSNIVVLQERVNHHVQEEEANVLPVLEAHCDATKLEEMGNQYTQVKNSV